MAIPRRAKESILKLPPSIGWLVYWILIDTVIILAAYNVAFSLRAVTTPLNYAESAGFFLFATAVNLLCLFVFGVYKRIWSMTSGHDITVILGAFGVGASVVALVDLMIHERLLPLSVVLMGNILAFGGVAATRYRSRLVTGLSWRWRAVWRGEFPRQDTPTILPVLIVGAGESGQMLALRMKHRFPKSGQTYRVIGFVDDDPLKQGMYVEGCPVLGTRTEIAEIAERHKVELIVIALHRITGTEFREILSTCEKTKARIKVVPDMLGLMTAKDTGTLLRDVQPQDLLGRSQIGRHEGIDLSLVTSKVILVTGAAGSIGSELCRQLCNFRANRVILLDNNESNLYELHMELTAKYPGVDLVPVLADITFKTMLYDVFEQHRPHIVFHAAAYKHVPMLEEYPDEALRVNIGGTHILLEMARDYDVERFVLISTDKAVNPSCVMGASKRICELMLRAYSQDRKGQTLYTSVRFGNVLGSRGSVLPIFEQQINNGGPITITHPKMTRYFMTIPEATNLVIHAACLTKGGEIYLLKMGEVVKIIDLAERMVRLRGLRLGTDVPVKYTGIRPGEKLEEELYSGSESIVDTVHPSILHLKSKHESLDTTAFWAALDDITQGRIKCSYESLMTVVNKAELQLPEFEVADVR